MYHTFDICQAIADKLRSPEYVCTRMQENVQRGNFMAEEWTQLSLAEGLPGIASFYGVMDQFFPNQGWDQVAYTYLKLTIHKTEERGISHTSLFAGLTGMCFAAYLCSKQGYRYPHLLSKLENLLFREIETSLLCQANNFLDQDQDAPPHFYNLTNGLSGVLAYLLVRKEQAACHRLASDCLSRLILLLKRKRCVKGYEVPGWYVSPEEQLVPEAQAQYPNGSFILSMSYGMTGCLSVLALAALEGIVVPGQYELIQEMATWLKSKQRQASSGPYWHHSVSFEDEISNQQNSTELTRDAWSYGNPTVSRSLYLAAKATRDFSLMKFAEDSFLSIFSKTWQEWNLMGPTFFWGRAGLLALTYHMAQDTGHPVLLKQIDYLENDLKRFYHPSHVFGFQTIHVAEQEDYHWIDHPGLLNGAIGIALALLLVHSQEEIMWPRIFLIK